MRQLPKAYLRLDPDLDAKHPDNLDEFMRLLCAANRQPWRGRFRSRAVVEALVGKGAAKRAIERGDLIPAGDHTCPDCPPGKARADDLYLDGWDIWQEGDMTVAERMKRYRNRNATVTESVTPTVTEASPEAYRSPSPPSETGDGRRKTVPTEPPPETPDPHDLDDLEVIADRLLSHPPTPGQWRALSGLARSVGRDRAIEAGRYWLTEGNSEDPFGALLDQLGSEATNKRKRKRSPNAYLDETTEDAA